MSSGSPPLLEGFYTSKSGIQIPFTAFAHKDCVAIILEKPVGQLAAISQHSRGQILHITRESFEDLKSNVLDKDVNWTNVKHIRFAETVPGTWRSDDGNKTKVITGYEEPEVFDSAIKGYYGGSRKHNHRKPTKRRRSRRVYRKPKKN
jgi:hypothetical protein